MAFINNHNVSVRERNLIINESIDEHKDHQHIADNHKLAKTTIDKYVRRYQRNGHVLTDYELNKFSAPNGKMPRKKMSSYAVRLRTCS